MKEGDWLPPILETVATRGQGVDKLLEAIQAHRDFMHHSGQLEAKRRRHLRDEVLDFVAEMARRRAGKQLADGTDIGRQLQEAPLSELDPYAIAHAVLDGG
jgi:LAO/AO transport system kinase